jgi:hypothetical protein
MFPQIKGSTIYDVISYLEFKKEVTEKRMGGKKDQLQQTKLDEKKARNYLNGKVVKIDEIHHYRNVTPGMVAEIEAIIRYSAYIIGMTGTPLKNQVTDFLYILMFSGIIPPEPVKQMTVGQNDGSNAANIPKTKKQFIDVFYKLKNKIFWFVPEQEQQNEVEDIFELVELEWKQSLQYVLNAYANTHFGNLCLSSAVRNSFDSKTRPITNCTLKPNPISDSKIKYVIDEAPKFLRIEKILEDCWLQPNRIYLPAVVYSNYIERGIDAFYQWFLSRPLGKQMVIECMTGKVSSSQRSSIRDRFVNNKIDVLLLSPVGNESLDLPNGAVIILMENQDCVADEQQILGRINRSGAVSCRPADSPPIRMIRLVSCFKTYTNPLALPTPDVIDDLWSTLCKESNLSRFDLMQYNVDVCHDLISHLKIISTTADQKRLTNNTIKVSHLNHLIACLKACSIPFSDRDTLNHSHFEVILKSLPNT